MDVKLVVVGGDAKTTEILLKLPTVIGRGKDCKVRLQHPLISRQHCEIFEVSGQLMVKDLGSLNGTFINNERITEAALPAGQLLTIGAVTFRAMYEILQEAADELNKTADMGKTTTIKAPAPPDATTDFTPDSGTKKPASGSSESMEFDFTEVDQVEVFDDASGVLPPSVIPKGGFKPPPAHAISPMPGTAPAVPPAPSATGAAPMPGVAPLAKPVGPAGAQPMAFVPPAATSPPPATPADPAKKPDEDDDDLNSFLKSLGK